MMSELGDLYQELILDHNKRPRNRRRLDDANRKADGFNPLCGDRVSVYLKLDGDRVVDIGFEGKGCAISTASASLMTEVVKGRTVAEVRELFERFHDLVTGESVEDNEREELGKLEVFSGVSRYPARVKCASLAWHAVHAALENTSAVVTTE